MKLSLPRLVTALAVPILGMQNGFVHGQFTLKAEDGPHEAVWLQVRAFLAFSSGSLYAVQQLNFFMNSGPTITVGIPDMSLGMRKVGSR